MCSAGTDWDRESVGLGCLSVRKSWGRATKRAGRFNSQGNDVVDWEQIVTSYGPAVWSIAYRMLGRYQDASDCYQETFMQALKVARREPVRDWGSLLRRLATTCSLNALRKRYRGKTVGELAVETAATDAGPGPLQRAADAEFLARARGVLASLPAKEAKVFWLRFVEEQRYEEVATEMGVSVNAVGVLIHRVRKRLREHLKGFAPTGGMNEVSHARTRKDRGRPAG